MALQRRSVRYSRASDAPADYRIELLTASAHRFPLNRSSTLSAEVESFNAALPYNTEIRLSPDNFALVNALIAEEVEANYEGLHNLFAH